MPAATFRKATAGGYLEYGVTSYLSVIAAPTLARQNGSGAENSVTGSDSSAFGARLQLYGAPKTVIAVQALVQPPLGAGSMTSQLAAGGAKSFAVDLRVMFGPALGSKRTKPILWKDCANSLINGENVQKWGLTDSTHSRRGAQIITEQRAAQVR